MSSRSILQSDGTSQLYPNFGHMPIDANICVAGHDVNLLIAQRFFNCVANNLVKDMNNKANLQKDSSDGKRKRKCVKLSSGGAQTC